jgi:hypothetical protein
MASTLSGCSRSVAACAARSASMWRVSSAEPRAAALTGKK